MILLLDVSSLLYRAHYAVLKSPGGMLTSRDGTPTGGLFGLLNTLVRLVKDMDPEAVIACFDAGEDPARLALFPGYKASRKKAREADPDKFQVRQDVQLQAELLEFRFFPALGMPRLRIADREADDIIAAAVRACSGAGINTCIITGDSDFLQLVSERVSVFAPWGNHGRQDEVVTIHNFVEHMRMQSPQHFLAWKCLSGDDSDDIPGVPSVGDKTALQLVTHHGTLREILADKDVILAKGGASWHQKKLFEPKGLLALRRNIQLIDLAYGPRLDTEVLTLLGQHSGAADYREFMRHAHELDGTKFCAFAHRYEQQFTEVAGRWPALWRQIHARAYESAAEATR